jgi:hypothetical protein
VVSAGIDTKGTILRPLALNLEPLAARVTVPDIMSEASRKARASPLPCRDLRRAGFGAGRPVPGCIAGQPPDTKLMMNHGRRLVFFTAPRSELGDGGDSTRIIRSQMKHADALTLQARHCLPFVVVAVQRLYGLYMMDSRVMRAYGQNRGASNGGK